MPNQLDFLIIGSQRCATSSLFSSISDSGYVAQPLRKEMNFFSSDIYTKSLDWYLQQFKKSNSDELCGEASPSYSLMRTCEIAVLKKKFPDLKIILITRDPIARMWSAIMRQKKFSYKADVKEVGDGWKQLIQFVLTPSNFRFGQYSKILKDWGSFFSSNQILHIPFEKIQSSPEEAIKLISQFLGIGEFSLNKVNVSSAPSTENKNYERINYLLYKLYQSDISEMSKSHPLTKSREATMATFLEGYQASWLDFCTVKVAKMLMLNCYPIFKKFDNIVRSRKLNKLGY